jgi:hypothetical protein
VDAVPELLRLDEHQRVQLGVGDGLHSVTPLHGIAARMELHSVAGPGAGDLPLHRETREQCQPKSADEPGGGPVKLLASLEIPVGGVCEDGSQDGEEEQDDHAFLWRQEWRWFAFERDPLGAAQVLRSA